MSDINRVWCLRKRPVGEITNDVLSFEEEGIPEPGDGECPFRLNYLSLDPTNRIWMSDMDQYMPPVELDAPRRGVGGGRINPSNFPEHRFGALRFVYRRSGPSLLVAEGLHASVSRKTGELRGFRRASERARRTGRGVATVVMFLLVPQVKIPKRLDVDERHRRIVRIEGLAEPFECRAGVA